MLTSLPFVRRVALSLALAACAGAFAQGTPGGRAADFIVAVVNQELVTNGEVQQRLSQVEREARQNGSTLPPRDQLAQQIVDALIDERAQLSYARESGVRVDDAEIERVEANVAAQNGLTVAQLRDRLRRDGTDTARFRNNLRDQIMLERVREREVNQRIRITDADIDNLLASRESGVSPPEYNIAQILVAVPDGASEDTVTERRERAEQALRRVQGGEAFDRVVAEMSNGPKEQGGALGLRPADRLPDLFVEAVRGLRAGDVSPKVVRSGAGFHVLKLIDRKDGGLNITQTHARHILLRPSAQLSQATAVARLKEMRQQITSGRADFARVARDNSEDGSAPQGGDLGWASPGQFVPEFEQAMNRLAINEVSEPVQSRFGLHLLQVLERKQISIDRKQQREIARNVLRSQRFEAAYRDWATEIRARAYVEMREPPQ
jgi:peptidyl-prolyl cis-trans isomerase SurA